MLGGFLIKSYLLICVFIVSPHFESFQFLEVFEFSSHLNLQYQEQSLVPVSIAVDCIIEQLAVGRQERCLIKSGSASWRKDTCMVEVQRKQSLESLRSRAAWQVTGVAGLETAC